MFINTIIKSLRIFDSIKINVKKKNAIKKLFINAFKNDFLLLLIIIK